MRDQIKAWLGSSDIKDKTALLDNRKLIETVSNEHSRYLVSLLNRSPPVSEMGFADQWFCDPPLPSFPNLSKWSGSKR